MSRLIVKLALSPSGSTYLLGVLFPLAVIPSRPRSWLRRTHGRSTTHSHSRDHDQRRSRASSGWLCVARSPRPTRQGKCEGLPYLRDHLSRATLQVDGAKRSTRQPASTSWF